ncbi:hypothetical protein GUY61_09640 [Streptomyces sp. GC420]|nr:hypothetical protein [Streptomyces sp. GC420]
MPEDEPGTGRDRRSGRHTAAEPSRASGQVLDVLPFGAGLTLIGLGLGFIGLRLRNR